MSKLLPFFSGDMNLKVVKAYKDEIDSSNLKMIVQISTFGMVGGVCLIIGSLLPFPFLALLEGYIALTIVSTIMYVLAKKVLIRYHQLILPVYYFLLSLVFIAAIAMGTVLRTDTSAVTIVVLIVVIPMFIFDYPGRINLFIGGVCVIFCIVTSLYKVPRLAQVDCVNAITFYVFSIFLTIQSIKNKIRDLHSQEVLRSQRDTDILTGLWNRGFCEKAILNYISSNDHSAVFIILDVDNFKTVNDTQGHDCGDEVLIQFGKEIKKTFRSTDIVGRLGGDEFLVFLPDCQNMDVILKKMKGLIERVGNIQVEGYEVPKIGTSAGISIYPQGGHSFQELYKSADAALYQAKRFGKNQFVIHDEKESSND